MVFILLSGCTGQDALDEAKDLKSDIEIVCAAENEALCQWPDQDLEKSFAEYWEQRFSGPVDAVFAMEAPYFQFAIFPERYNAYVKKWFLYENDKIEVFSINNKTDHMIEIPVRIWFKDASNSMRNTSFLDRWVRVNGRWYHVIRDPIFFPEAS